MVDSPNIINAETAKPTSPIAPVGNLTKVIFVSIVWIMIGICFIFGVRMWFNSTINPLFMAISGATFSAAISFTLVLYLQQVVGIIKIEGPMGKFEGASGPLVMWCACFLVIIFGLYLLGFVESIKSTKDIDQRSILQLFNS